MLSSSISTSSSSFALTSSFASSSFASSSLSSSSSTLRHSSLLSQVSGGSSMSSPSRVSHLSSSMDASCFKDGSTSYASLSRANPETPIEDGRCGLLDLPEELIVSIAEYLLELDLSRLSQTCHRLSRICNDSELWRHLYVDLFEYDRPLLLQDKERKFVFSLDDTDANNSNYNNNSNSNNNDEKIFSNPWREPFKTLYRGMHVRPGKKKIYADKPALIQRPTRPPAPIDSAPLPGVTTTSTMAGTTTTTPTTTTGDVPK